MSTPAFTPSHGAASRPASPPYAFPPAGNAAAERAPNAGRVVDGPYVPAPWRGRPAEARINTPLTAAPVGVAEVTVGELSTSELPTNEMPASEMPPSYPTPAYFTPLGTTAQDDVLTPAFAIPAILEETDSLPTALLVDPDAVVEPSAPSLPWIDAFLSSTPAMPMRSVEEAAALDAPPTSDAIVEEAEAETAEWPLSEVAQAAPTPSDAWALDEAAERMRSLADELRHHDGMSSDASGPSRLFDAPLPPEPLPAWSDDDMIDIMPIRHERTVAQAHTPTPRSVSAIEPWADRARRVGDESAEAAARALELLARRVREGEISLAGYEPRLGDAAALAAALAALLGVRR